MIQHDEKIEWEFRKEKIRGYAGVSENVKTFIIICLIKTFNVKIELISFLHITEYSRSSQSYWNSRQGSAH